MAAALERRVFLIDVAEPRAPRHERRVEIATGASLQQLHLTLLVALDHPPPYSAVDRTFRIETPTRSYAYDEDALATLRDVFETGMRATYRCEAAGRHAGLVVADERIAVKRARYPVLLDGDPPLVDRVFSEEARYAANHRYLHEEPRPQAQAFRNGVYSAAVAGPPTSPSAFLELVLPSTDFSTMDAANVQIDVVMREYNAVATALHRDPEGYVADLGTLLATRDDVLDWTHGFAFAMALNGDTWEARTKVDEQWAKTFEAISFMFGIAREHASWAWLDDAAYRAMIVRTLGVATANLWNRWREAGEQPVRRAGPKVGVNAPCPCGSGRKYKRCCSATR